MTRKDRRAKLSRKLHEMFPTGVEIAFEPPESKKLTYPALVYYRMRSNTVKADNLKYLTNDRYQITYIHKEHDDPNVDKLLELPYCEHDNEFTQNNMHHDIFTIYVQ